MDFSKLGQSDRLALGAGGVIVLTALLSLINGWGAAMVLSLAGGAAAIAIAVQPQLAPTATLPASKTVLLLGAGAVATLASGLVALDWMGWIVRHIVSFDTIQFMTGLVAAVALLAASYMSLQRERAMLVPPAA